MESIKIFQNEQFGKVRVAMNKSNEPLFCLADVCNVIGISNARNVRRRLEPEDVHQIDTLTGGGNQQVTFVTESGLYDVVIRSDSEMAKPFRKWITSLVLPSIRKTGGYINNTQAFIESYFSNLDESTKAFLAITLDDKKKLLEENKKQKELLEYREPLAILGDAVMEYDNDITINELAKILCQNGIDTGGSRLREQFKDEKYLNRNGLPSQRSIENGWLAIAKNTYDHPTHGTQLYRKAVVTPKGQKYFVNKFLKTNRYDTN